jgi:hypothetical protein
MRLRRHFTRPCDKGTPVASARPDCRAVGPTRIGKDHRAQREDQVGRDPRLVRVSIVAAGRAFARACAKRLRLASANDLAGRRRSRCGPPCPPSPPKSQTFPEQSRSAAARPAGIFLFSASDTASNPLRSMRPLEIHGDGVRSPLLRMDGVSFWLSSTKRSNHVLLQRWPVRPNLPEPFRNACCGQFKRRPAPEGRWVSNFTKTAPPRWGGKPRSGQGSRCGR